jgi:23S rRNA (guanine745-N1)-methyltransferase
VSDTARAGRRLPPAAALEYLRCPHCGANLTLQCAALVCAAGHAFDVARQGYVHLAPGRALAGDTAAMVEAREAFLAAGHFATVTAAVVRAVTEVMAAAGAGCVLDVGAGTGHHLAAVLEAAPGRVGIALDSSTAALRRAARAHARIAAIACDAWGPLPLVDGAAAVALSVFAPRGGAELARVVAPGGALVVVTPTQAHLAELVAALGLVSVDPRKEERLARALGEAFAPVDARVHETVLALGHEDVRRLVAMGPSAHHTDRETVRRRVAELPEPVAATLSVRVAAFRRR